MAAAWLNNKPSSKNHCSLGTFGHCPRSERGHSCPQQRPNSSRRRKSAWAGLKIGHCCGLKSAVRALRPVFFFYSAGVVTLEHNILCSRLSAPDLERLRNTAREQTFRAGQEIFKEGDPGNGLYLVKDGLIEISVLGGQSGRYIFTEVGPGELLGEMAVIEDQPRSANAVARKESVLYFLPRKEILELMGQCPSLSLAFLREVSHRLRGFNRQYLREVLQAERLSVVGRFARSIVHDLKNPLNIIGLTSEMAAMKSDSPETRQKALLTIREQVDRINELVSEILEFTQGKSPELVLPPMDFAKFIDDVVQQIRGEAALRSSTIELENSPPSVMMQLNPKRLRRLFYNLVHNATDAMPHGGKILLRFRTEPGAVITEMEDTGPGIAPEIAGQLFEAFATFGKSHGTGLGLSICKKIVEDHHGWITTRTEPGHGAIFEFGLPLPQSASA
jgi:signal transduction histidine kinase